MDGSMTPCIDEKKFINLMKGLKAAYTSATFLPDDKAVKVWYAMLKDLPLDALSLAVQKHIATEKFPPTIAELRAHCADIICADLDDWTEAWSKVLDVVSGYGLSNGQEGIKQLDPATREAVKRVGGFVIFSSMRPRCQATSSFFFMAGNVLALSSLSSFSSSSSDSSAS